MKKITVTIVIAMSAQMFIQCNNASTGEAKSDTASHQADTVKTQIVTEGGLKDSISTGASDTTKKKDPAKK